MERSIVHRETKVHIIYGLLEYILPGSILDYHQTDASHVTNQPLAHAMHWLCIIISESTNKTDIYTKPPKSPKEFEIPDLPNFTDRYIYVYKLINNLYGLKDAIKTWYE